MLCSCSAFSGKRPVAVSETDRREIDENQRTLPPIPLITHEIDGKTVKIYGVVFDGTMNDMGRIPDGERESLVAHIYGQIKDQICAHYSPGPGMQNKGRSNPIDAAIGYSSPAIAQKAKEIFFEKAEQWLKEEPNTETRVFVAGFSRGAAISRHFMNLVEQEWKAKTIGDHTPYFYALLFDTVATFQEKNLKLSLPASLDYLIHIVAKDEPRGLFRHVIDEEDDIDLTSTGVAYPPHNYFSISRINLRELPGSHSDIGATYQTGIGSAYRVLAEQILYAMGLSDKNVWNLDYDPLVQGKHDPRGLFDIAIGTPAPNSEQSVNRQPIRKKAIVTKARHADNIRRLNSMVKANAERGVRQEIGKKENPGLTLEIERRNEAIFVHSCKSGSLDSQGFTTTCDSRFSDPDGKRSLDVDVWYVGWNKNAQKASSTLPISDAIWKRLKEGEVATLSYSRLEKGKKTYLVTYLNDKRIDCSPVKEP